MAPTSYLAAFLLIIFVLMDFSCGLKCFLDTRGIYPPEDGTPVNTSEFRVFDCNLLGGDQKSCISKTDQSGLVTRNCGLESGKSAGCEKDVHGNKICHCLLDYCNGSDVQASLWTATVILIGFIRVFV